MGKILPFQENKITWLTLVDLIKKYDMISNHSDILFYLYLICLSGPSVFPADPGPPCLTPLRVPVLTSTPVCPPPPPLPPPAAGTCVEVSVSDVVRQRQAAKREKLAQCDPSVSTAPAMPSMLEMLKDLNQVKLRSVQRYGFNKLKLLAQLRLKFSTEYGFVFVDLQVELQ